MRNYKNDIIVIVVAFMMCVATFVLGVSFAKSTAKTDFCSFINASLAVPAPKPDDAAAHPGRQELYLESLKYRALNQTYHCGNEG